jgi:hypothetical protein
MAGLKQKCHTAESQTWVFMFTFENIINAIKLGINTGM